MGWSPSALFHEMLLLCIPKLWKQRYRWLNFGSVFSVWSVFFGHLFISLQTFVLFFFAWQYVWFLLFPRSCDEQSNQIPCSQDVVTWSHLHQDSDEDSVRNLLWFFVCKSIMSHHTQIDLILFIFFPVWCFCQWSDWRGVFALIK